MSWAPAGQLKLMMEVFENLDRKQNNKDSGEGRDFTHGYSDTIGFMDFCLRIPRKGFSRLLLCGLSV